MTAKKGNIYVNDIKLQGKTTFSPPLPQTHYFEKSSANTEDTEGKTKTNYNHNRDTLCCDSP